MPTHELPNAPPTPPTKPSASRCVSGADHGPPRTVTISAPAAFRSIELDREEGARWRARTGEAQQPPDGGVKIFLYVCLGRQQWLREFLHHAPSLQAEVAGEQRLQSASQSARCQRDPQPDANLGCQSRGRAADVRRGICTQPAALRLSDVPFRYDSETSRVGTVQSVEYDTELDGEK
jgi:hypothetical protein